MKQADNISIKEILSESRGFLMGIAILIIAIYHVPNHTNVIGLEFLHNIGYGGADLFILLSGFGAFHSLSKDEDAWRFLKRRAARILPSYMPFIIIWMIVHKFLLRLYFTEICGNLTMMGWWNGDENQLNWYVDCIVVFYILAPYIYKAMTTAKNRMLAVIILIGVALVLGVAFFHGQLIIAVSRLPIFIMGFAFAGITNSLTEGKRAILIWNLLMIIGFAFMYVLMHQQAIDLWHYGLYWYPFILITPGFAIDFGLLYSCLGGNNIGKIIAGLFDKLGAASFEIFLIHLFVYENFMLISTTNWLGWSIMLVGSFVVGYGYHVLLNSIMKKISRR